MEVTMSAAAKVARDRLIIRIIININYFGRQSLDTIVVSGWLIFALSRSFIVMGFTIINRRRVLDILSMSNGLRNRFRVLDRSNLHGIDIGWGNSDSSTVRIGNLGLKVRIPNTLDILLQRA
jgi:hypothetical protein